MMSALFASLQNTREQIIRLPGYISKEWIDFLTFSVGCSNNPGEI